MKRGKDKDRTSQELKDRVEDEDTPTTYLRHQFSKCLTYGQDSLPLVKSREGLPDWAGWLPKVFT